MPEGNDHSELDETVLRLALYARDRHQDWWKALYERLPPEDRAVLADYLELVQQSEASWEKIDENINELAGEPDNILSFMSKIESIESIRSDEGLSYIIRANGYTVRIDGQDTETPKKFRAGVLVATGEHYSVAGLNGLMWERALQRFIVAKTKERRKQMGIDDMIRLSTIDMLRGASRVEKFSEYTGQGVVDRAEGIYVEPSVLLSYVSKNLRGQVSFRKLQEAVGELLATQETVSRRVANGTGRRFWIFKRSLASEDMQANIDAPPDF